METYEVTGMKCQGCVTKVTENCQLFQVSNLLRLI